MPDFFVPGVEYDAAIKSERKQSRTTIKESDLQQIAKKVQNLITSEMIKAIGAVYLFSLKG